VKGEWFGPDCTRFRCRVTRHTRTVRDNPPRAVVNSGSGLPNGWGNFGGGWLDHHEGVASICHLRGPARKWRPHDIEEAP
jgi:hypothetical protein